MASRLFWSRLRLSLDINIAAPKLSLGEGARISQCPNQDIYIGRKVVRRFLGMLSPNMKFILMSGILKTKDEGGGRKTFNIVLFIIYY